MTCAATRTRLQERGRRGRPAGGADRSRRAVHRLRDPARPRTGRRGRPCTAAGRAEGGEIIALLPEGTVPLGAAIDVGTTKLAAYLVNLETGETVAKGAAPNPQVAIGEDVMSRIAYADAHDHGAHGTARAAR